MSSEEEFIGLLCTQFEMLKRFAGSQSVSQILDDGKAVRVSKYKAIASECDAAIDAIRTRLSALSPSSPPTE